MLQYKKEEGTEKNQVSLVRKSNDLIAGDSKLTVSELKLFTMVLEQIKTTDSSLRKYYVTAEEFGKKIGMVANPYKFLEKVSDKLQGRVIEIPTGLHNVRKKINLFLSVVYQDKKGKLAVEMHPDLEPHILKLKSRFTKYESRFIYKLKSKYVIRFYEYVKAQMGLQRKNEYIVIELSIEKLREVLDLGNKFERISSLKDRVITKLGKEINKNTDLKVTIKDIKEGKKIIAFNFTINIRKERIENIDIELAEEVKERTEIELKIEKLGIVIKDIKEDLKNYSDDEIKKAIRIMEEKIRRKEPIYTKNNYFGEVLKSCKESDYEKKYREEKEEREIKRKEETQKVENEEKTEAEALEKKREKTINAYEKLSKEEKEFTIGFILEDLKTNSFTKELLIKADIKDKTDLNSYENLLKAKILIDLEHVLFQ